MKPKNNEMGLSIVIVQKNRSVGTMLSRGQSRESRRKRAYVSKPVIINYKFCQFVKAIGFYFFPQKIIMIKKYTTKASIIPS